MLDIKDFSIFENQSGFKKALLTTSCTDALEMCALLIDCAPEDEIIVPSYTFVSTALAFVRQGAKIIFADSEVHNPNLDVSKLESLITPKTKGICLVHMCGGNANMDEIMAVVKEYNLILVEDAGQALGAFYKGKSVGLFGAAGAFSFDFFK